MRADEIFSEVTAVYDNYVNALETGSVEALRAYARDLSERIVRRGVETDEVLGTVLLLRDVLARASLALDAPGSLEEILQLVAEHARELVAAERCRAEIRLPDGVTIDAHAEAEPGAEPVSVAPADVAALFAAVAPGRRSVRMSSAELAAEPARRALEAAGDRVRAMRSWLVASLCAPAGNEVGLIQAFDKRDGEFTHLDEEVLVELAQMAAAAVERAQRYAHRPP